MDEGKPMIAKEELGLDKDGKQIFISTSKIPIKDSRNRVIGIIGIGRDITMQKEAEEELKKNSEFLKETNVLLEERQEEIQQMAEELNTQAENLKEINTKLERLSLVASKTENVVVIMDGNGNFEWVNEGFEKKYELDFESFVKKNGENIRENSSNENISTILNQIYITNKPYTYNSQYTDDKGDVFWSLTNITPILNSDKEVSNLILIDSDITDLKNAESQINAQRNEMELIAVELQKTNATKDRLFSIIAHDLKNPFHSILGFTSILQSKYKDIEREKLKEFLGMIHDSTSSAYQLLENLLEWARTQTNNVNFRPTMTNVRAIADEAVSLLSLNASNKNITFKNDIDESLMIFADQNMLTTVIRNISGNAIKFTNEGGSITFTSTTDKAFVRINIIDSGVGMPQERVNSLFDLDKVKSSAGTTGETGTGLGLLVCAEFMKLNNGEIKVASKPGKGSTFTLELPIKTTE
jgi:PAS domain S-box-containing protein